ncbi:nitrite reductase small subunit NirD [Paenibacillus sp. sptzw28]|jgi:nitrite reductase (NADH) small subunit|uniref:nitrite reductase small subunit NirD n=1 Tax=Paenibacillus sp. sptzw28 TaxID=715179 RepID=UPI001C6EA002|nr:nitrite reductase small subunit NirD [Paenibacillus sp. sptzw28]QYR22009.1 nitrite reductase small subunit NirD [Paenibacillus sp. sptzw28]
MNEVIVGHISEFPERRGRVFRLGELELALFKLSDGEVKAVENLCPHKNGKLSEGMVCDHHVYCPLHDWKIDLHDGLVQAPDEGCVRTFPITVDASGNVVLTIGAPAETKVS